MTTEKAAPPGIALDNEALARLEALARAATPGPWKGDRFDGTVKYALYGADNKSVITGDNGNSDSGPFGIHEEDDEKYLMAFHPITVLQLIDQARAAQPQPSAAPDGWQWAPIEPTEEMVHAGEDVPAPRPFAKVYRAMLAAAPSPNFAARGAAPAGIQAARKAFDDRYLGYEFPSSALRSGALDEFIAGWKAAQAASQPTAAPTPPSPSTAEVDERYSPSVLDVDGLSEVIAGVLRSDGDAVALAALYALLNGWGSEQRQHARRAAMRVVELASRPAVEAGELPPLPDATSLGWNAATASVMGYTQDDMHAYGQKSRAFGIAEGRIYQRKVDEKIIQRLRTALATKPATKE